MQIDAKQLELLIGGPVPAVDKDIHTSTDTDPHSSDVLERADEWYINHGKGIDLTGMLRGMLNPVPEGDTDGTSQETPDNIPVSPPVAEPVDTALIAVTAGVLRPSGYEVAIENEITLLMTLWKFHWLTSLQLAMWLSMSVQMVRRTLRRMRSKGRREVARARLPNGGWAYFLAKRGAERLRWETGKDVKAVRLRTFGNWEHRAISNYHIIALREYRRVANLTERIQLYSEYEIQAGRAPIHTWDGKIPDALMVYTNEYGDDSFHWVEIENARRSTPDKKQLADFLIARTKETEHISGTSFGSLHLVSTRRQLLIEVCRNLCRYLDGKDIEVWQQYKAENWIRLFHIDISPGLIYNRYHNFLATMEEFDPEFGDEE